MFVNLLTVTLGGTNISHLGKRKFMFKSAFGKGYVSSQQSPYPFNDSSCFGMWNLFPALKPQFFGVLSTFADVAENDAMRFAKRIEDNCRNNLVNHQRFTSTPLFLFAQSGHFST